MFSIGDIKIDPGLAYLISSAVIKLAFSYKNSKKRPGTAIRVGELSEISIFPVKSMRALKLESAICTHRGLKHHGKQVFDRNLLVVDENGVFIHARAEPKMATISTNVTDDNIVLDCNGQPPLKLPIDYSREANKKVYQTKVWGELVEGQDCGDEATEWICTCLNRQDLRLIHGTEGLLQRELVLQDNPWKKHAKSGDKVTFQDGYPFLLISQPSLDDLNARTPQEHFSMSRFRTNFVVTGCDPFDEDEWSEIWIGDQTKFTNVKPCHRCILTQIDPETGARHKEEEPLRSLRKYRLDRPNFDNSPLFGVNLVLDSSDGGVVRVGDPVYALRKES